MSAEDVGLNIVIGADVKAAVSGLDQVNAGLDKTAEAATAVTPAVTKAVTDINKIAPASKEASITIADLRTKLKDLKAELETTTGGRNIQKLNVQIKGLEDAIQSATTVAKPANENFEKMRTIFEDVGRVLEGKDISVRSFAQNFALVGPAVTIAAAAIAFFGKELYDYLSEANSAEQAQRLLNKTLGEAVAGTQGEISSTQDLIGIITNETQSRQLRNAAFQELQDKYPNALKNMTLETTSLQDLYKATDHLTEALIRQAEIKGLEGAISDIAKQEADLMNQTATGFFSSLNIFDKLKVVIGGVGGGIGSATTAGAILGEQFEKNNVTFGALNSKLKELITTSLQLGDNGILGGKHGGKGSVIADQNLEFEKQIKALTEQSEGIKGPLAKAFQQSAEGSVGDINFNVFQDQLAKATAAAAKGSISSETFLAYRQALANAFNKTANPNLTQGIDIGIEDNGLSKKEADLDKNVQAIGKHIRPIPLHLTIAGFDQAQVDTATEKMNKIGQQLTSILQNALESGIAAVSSSIASGSVGDIFSSLEAIIGDGLEQLGKALLTTFPIIKAAKTAITAAITSPELLAVAGVLSIAAGAAIKGLASKKGIHAFADGGIVTSATLGVFGEAGPEAVMPLDDLNKFVKQNSGNGGGYIPSIKLKGADLLIAFKRAQGFQDHV